MMPLDCETRLSGDKLLQDRKIAIVGLHHLEAGSADKHMAVEGDVGSKTTNGSFEGLALQKVEPVISIHQVKISTTSRTFNKSDILVVTPNCVWLLFFNTALIKNPKIDIHLPLYATLPGCTSNNTVMRFMALFNLERRTGI